MSPVSSVSDPWHAVVREKDRYQIRVMLERGTEISDYEGTVRCVHAIQKQHPRTSMNTSAFILFFPLFVAGLA